MSFRADVEEETSSTSPQFIYFIQQGMEGPIKIGISMNPQHRLSVLQTAQTTPLRLLAVLPGNKSIEQELHQRFSYARMVVSGKKHTRKTEWFQPIPALLECIEEINQTRGLQGQYSMVPSSPAKGFR